MLSSSAHIIPSPSHLTLSLNIQKAKTFQAFPHVSKILMGKGGRGRGADVRMAYLQIRHLLFFWGGGPGGGGGGGEPKDMLRDLFF